MNEVCGGVGGGREDFMGKSHTDRLGFVFAEVELTGFTS